MQYVLLWWITQVSAEIDAYKSTRRAALLQELVGQLEGDSAAAAAKLEQQTAELQRLEAAVTDKAAVLQKLTEQAEAKQVRAAGNWRRPVPAMAACTQRIMPLWARLDRERGGGPDLRLGQSGWEDALSVCAAFISAGHTTHNAVL